ncbi:MAG: HAMP domain-containing protein [Sphingobium sp.]|nr:HAMP domain-containing protein [Sphingobium sp.]
MTIQRACRIGSLALVAILLGFGVFSAYQFNQLRFGGSVHHQNQMMSDLTADILPPPEYVIEAYLEATKLASDPASLATRKEKLAALEKQFREREAYWKDSDLAADLKAGLLDKAVAKGNDFWTEIDGGFLSAVEQGDAAAVQASYARIEAIYQAHRADVDALVREAGDEQAALAGKTASRIKSTLVIVGVLAAIVFAAFILAVGFLGRRVLAPLRDLTNAMLRMGQGELDLEIPGAERRDELGGIARALDSIKQNVERKALEDGERQMAVQRQVVGALGEGLGSLKDGKLTFRIHQPFPSDYEALRGNFNDTVDALADLISQVTESAASVRIGADEIASAANDLSQRTESQAASLEETAASMKQITTSVGDAASTAVNASGSAQSARSEASESSAVMTEAVSAMEAISRTSDQMQSIVAIIDGIAFQTNLLALNAGVEAARAGDAGNGFAVVANEVRALALRASEAAKEIGQLIGESGREVTNGVHAVRQTHASLERIVTRTADVSELIDSLADSGQAQSTAIVQVNTVVSDLDSITQQNAALVEEASAASRSLSIEANRLATLVSRFDAGGRRVSTPVPVAAQPAFKPSKALKAATQGNAALAVSDEDWQDF